jgi:hypothetical protein
MKKFFIFLFLIGIGCLSSAQTNARYINIKYTYLIGNVISEEQLNQLTEELLQIKGVENVKYQYKPEKQLAQIIIYTEQKVRQSESDEEFNITALKAAVIKYQLLPLDFKEEVLN